MLGKFNTHAFRQKIHSGIANIVDEFLEKTIISFQDVQHTNFERELIKKALRDDQKLYVEFFKEVIVAISKDEAEASRKVFKGTADKSHIAVLTAPTEGGGKATSLVIDQSGGLLVREFDGSRVSFLHPAKHVSLFSKKTIDLDALPKLKDVKNGMESYPGDWSGFLIVSEAKFFAFWEAGKTGAFKKFETVINLNLLKSNPELSSVIANYIYYLNKVDNPRSKLEANSVLEAFKKLKKNISLDQKNNCAKILGKKWWANEFKLDSKEPPQQVKVTAGLKTTEVKFPQRDSQPPQLNRLLEAPPPPRRISNPKPVQPENVVTFER